MSDDYQGEMFLDKLYKNLYLSNEVMHTYDRKKSKAQNIRTYLNRLERLHSKATTQKRKERILNLYYDKYVIKFENIDEDKLPPGESKYSIIEHQKQSLKKWLNYLTDSNSNYPIWAKYWVFQGMLSMGVYDDSKGAYGKRTRKTLAPFIKCDPAIVAQSIDLIIKYNNGKPLEDEEVEKIVSTGSFNKIYGKLLLMSKNKKRIQSNPNDGIWIKYNQGSREDAEKLHESLKEYDTKWCTESLDTANRQLCGHYSDAENGGDFYVYYTKDNNDEYKVPRIAIRMIDKTRIAEIRGVDEAQDLEEGLEDILIEKLDTIDNLIEQDKLKALRKVKEMKILSEIIKKNQNDVELTVDELLILYSDRIIGFGWENNSRIYKLIESRDKKKKLQNDFDLLPSLDAKLKLLGNLNSKHTNLLIKDYGIALAAVTKDGDYIRYVSKNIFTEELVLIALKTNCFILSYLPNTFKVTKEFCIKCVKINGEALSYIIENYKELVDKDLMMLAVKTTPMALIYIPKEYQDADILYEAVKSDRFILKHIKSSIINNNALPNLIYKETNILVYIPEELITKELVEISVINNPDTFEFVPKKFITKELLAFFVKNHSNPKDVIAPDLSIKKDYIDLIDEDIAIEILSKDWTFIKVMPKDMLTYKCLLSAVIKNGKSIKNIPEELIDAYLVVLALKTYKDAIYYVPDDMTEREVFESVLNKDGKMISCIPCEYIDEELAQIAVEQNEEALEFIPNDKEWYESFISKYKKAK